MNVEVVPLGEIEANVDVLARLRRQRNVFVADGNMAPGRVTDDLVRPAGGLEGHQIPNHPQGMPAALSRRDDPLDLVGEEQRTHPVVVERRGERQRIAAWHKEQGAEAWAHGVGVVPD